MFQDNLQKTETVQIVEFDGYSNLIGRGNNFEGTLASGSVSFCQDMLDLAVKYNPTIKPLEKILFHNDIISESELLEISKSVGDK